MHPLDNPIWHALTNAQTRFAEVHGLAARFAPEVTGLAGLAAPSLEALEALAVLLYGSQQAGLFLDEVPALPPGLEIVESAALVQMVQSVGAPAPHATMPADHVELGPADVPEMIALAALTRPGPFGTRTIELGTFLGIRADGRLAAMAGQRLRLDGLVEVSGVCTHPEHLGRGHAARLSAAIADRIRAAGDAPVLHVRADNIRAVGLYDRLGFIERRRMHYVVVRGTGRTSPPA